MKLLPPCAGWEVLGISPMQSPATPTHTAFIALRPPGCCSCVPRSHQPAPHPTAGSQRSWTGRNPIRDQGPLLSPALSLPGEPPGGSRQTTVSPGTPGVVGPLREKFILSISPLLACQAQAHPPPVCHWALLTQMSTVKGALRPPPPSWDIQHKASVAMRPTGPLQEPRLPHLQNCQNLTRYFIMRLAVAAAANADRYGRYLTVCQMTNPN